MVNACLKAVLEALSDFLKDGMPELKQIIEEFPAPNQKLNYPALSIMHSGDPVFAPVSPVYILEQGSIVSHKAPVKYVVGQYELRLQLDFWCGNKEERYRIYEKFFNVFNAAIDPMGLSLQLEKYHDLWVRYDQVGHSLPDGEEASQRNEWRVRVDILATTKAVREKTENIITEAIENNLTTPDTV